jgi:hypothetical protein
MYELRLRCHGIGRHAGQRSLAEDYLARTTTMYRIIAVGGTCSLNQLVL